MFQSYFRHWPPCLMCVEVRPWSDDSSRVVLCVRGSLRAGQRDYVQNHCFATRLRRSVCLSQRKIAIFAMTKTSLIKSELTSWPAKTWSHCCFCVWMLAGCGSKQDKTTTWQHIRWLKKCRNSEKISKASGFNQDLGSMGSWSGLKYINAADALVIPASGDPVNTYEEHCRRWMKMKADLKQLQRSQTLTNSQDTTRYNMLHPSCLRFRRTLPR